MRRALIAIFCASLAVAGTAEARGRRHDAHGRSSPVVVELYTSQALAAAVPAEKLVGQLAEDDGVLVLTFPVDYWDYTGWPDTFAKPEFTDRQKAYVRRMALPDLSTPQIFVDGKTQLAGAETKGVETLIHRAERDKVRGPRMRLHHARLTIGAGPRSPGGADVWLVRYDPKVRQVTVKRGENRGQVIHERNVVRQLVRLGGWSGREKTYVVPADGPDSAGLKTAVLLQAAKGGRILAVLQR